MPCVYCGQEPSQLAKASGNTSAERKAFGAYSYSGLDRKDNARGYTIDNVVPCCRFCNVAKNSTTQDFFLRQIHAIAARWPRSGDVA